MEKTLYHSWHYDPTIILLIWGEYISNKISSLEITISKHITDTGRRWYDDTHKQTSHKKIIIKNREELKRFLEDEPEINKEITKVVCSNIMKAIQWKETTYDKINRESIPF